MDSGINKHQRVEEATTSMPDDAQPGSVTESTAADNGNLPAPVPALPDDTPTSRLESRHYPPGILEAIALIAITVVALTLRFTGIKWGTGYYLHPDELHLSSVLGRISMPISFREYLNSATSPLNPFNHETGFIYGTFPLFLAKWVGSFTEYTAINNNHVPGRWLSALADTGTVVFVWWIGRMLWNRWVGLLAALLLAFTVLHIQTAHYFTTDAWSAFFATGAFALVLAAWKYHRWFAYALAGLFVGLAAASKPNMLAAIGFLALPALETIRQYGWRGLIPRLAPPLDEDDDAPEGDVRHLTGPPIPVVLASALALMVAAWTFRIAQPYTFEGGSLFSFRLDPRWLADVDFWRGVQSGVIDYPPSHQWTERTPIIFQMKNLVLWGMGPALGISVLAGFAWQVWRIITARAWPSWLRLIPTGWIAFHIFYYGIALSKTQRYLLPAYPLLIVFGSAGIVAAFQWGWSSGRISIPRFSWSLRIPRWCHPGLVLPVIVVATTVFYGIAFTSIYTKPHSRVAASEWIVENVPNGSVIVNEYWDSGLPVGIPEMADHYYISYNISPYDDENPQKLTAMIGTLQTADYVILSSNRLVDSISRLPWRYPMANAYYDALFSGELGFEMVGHFTSYPELFGIEIDDREAEEALTVYDHPEVYIFRKTEAWNAHDAWYLLNDALGHGGLFIRPIQTQPQHMMLDPEGQQTVRAAENWSSIFDADSITNRLPVVFWYLGLQVIALAAVPFAWRLFPWLPDRGYAITKTLGLFLTAAIAWWIASTGLMEFGLGSITVSWLAVFALSLLASRARPQNLLADLRERLPWVIATEMLLLISYVIAIWTRSGNPDLWVPGWIGSQLQNMAAFNATVLTPSFPAYDPWLVDGTIHDFTFGLVPWAILTRVTGIVPETAYSLTLATLAALVALNAWALTALLVRRFRSSASWRIPVIGGLLGPVMVIAIGSWGLAQRMGTANWSLNFDATPRDAVSGLWNVLTSDLQVPDGAWRATTIWSGPGILEFPLFNYLTNEMAVQQLGLPLLVAALVVIVGYPSRPAMLESTEQRPFSTLGGWRPAITWLLAAGVVTGWTIATNPLFGAVVALLAVVLAFLSSAASNAWRNAWGSIRDTLLASAILGTTAVAAVWPFVSSYGYFATQRQAITQPLSVNDFSSFAGASFLIVVAFIVVQSWYLTHDELILHRFSGAISVVPVALIVAAVVLAWMTGVLALFLLLALFLIGALAWHHHTSTQHLALLGTIMVAVIVAIAANRIEFISWTHQQNIPLQFSIVSWTLLAIAASVIVVIAATAPWNTAANAPGHASRAFSILAVTASIVLIAAGAIYPGLAIPNQHDDRLASHDRTLDATAFMTTGSLALNANGSPVAPYALAPDLAATTWMRESLVGRPTILEAPASTTGWAGRVSALTGFPAVLGSVPVQIQQRPGMDRLVNWRYTDITTVFGDEGDFASIEPILQDYGVQVIYVGPLERATYASEALARFDQAVTDGQLGVLYEQDGVIIYQYNGPRISREYQGG
jgi:YYY domain-containing protein